MPARVQSSDELDVVDSYLHMARATASEGNHQLSDKYLFLAALFAERAGHLLVAESCRLQLVKRHPHHLFDGHRSVTAALTSPIVQEYARRLETLYSPAKTDYLLQRTRSQGYQGSHGFEELLPPRRVTPSPQASRTKHPPQHRRRDNERDSPNHTTVALPLEPVPFESPSLERIHAIPRVAFLACLAGAIMGVLIGMYLRPWLAP